MSSRHRSFLASPDGVNRLNAAKARLNLTNTAIAERAGVSADTVGRLWHPERGRRVSQASIIAIAAVLELRPEEIVPVVEWEIRLEKSLISDQVVAAHSQTAQVESREKVGLASIFISYRREEPDKTLAQFFAQELERVGLDVFIDTGIETGAEWEKEIDEALNSADYFLLLFSEKTFQGKFVEEEIITALERREKCGIPVIWPVRICLPRKHRESRYPWGRIYRFQHEFWESENDNTRILLKFINKVRQAKRVEVSSGSQSFIDTQESTSSPPSPLINILKLDGAALSGDSAFYVVREADKEVLEKMQQKRALIHVKGAKQTGKTSLIMRQYKAIGELNFNLRTVLIDFQALPGSTFESLNSLWYAIAEQISSTLAIDDWDNSWRSERTYNINVNKFLSSFIFNNLKTPILVGFDGVDYVFNTPIKKEFFSSIRSFYNYGAHDSKWENVRWLLSTSTEPVFFIEDLSQSPFNIGTRIDLNYFELTEVRKLAEKYELKLEERIVEKIFNYLGGHPYLTHLIINQLAYDIDSADYLFNAETAGNGFFQDHLNRYVRQFQKEKSLLRAMREVINGDGCNDFRVVDQLEGAALIKRDIYQRVIPMCELYEKFFGKVLCK
ncbi:AAA-like domain-containing protein [Cyanobacteria bacterium FACHB-471]|nr:AAA-like domain-containing protein [Cyanobacteria bacterium FACHB-471]